MQIGGIIGNSEVEKQDFKPIKAEKPTLKGELAKMKSMGRAAAWNYFWSYYKWWTVGLAVMVLCILAMSYSIWQNKKPRYLTGIFYNCYTAEDGEDFCRRFAQAQGIDEKKTPIRLTLNKMYGQEAANGTNEYVTGVQMEAQITAGSLDFVTADRGLVEELSSHSGVSYLADLTQVLPEDLMEKLEPYVIYCKDEQGNAFPAAIDVSHSRMMEELDFQQEEAFLGILANSQKTEHTAALLEYILFS